MNNIAFNVQFGTDNLPTQKPAGFTFGQLKRDSSLKMMLGFSDNVRALVNGVEMPDEAQVEAGTLVLLETKCNSKAS